MDFHLQRFSTLNFRGLGTLALNLNPRLNILAAENGTGKTSIVEMLRAVLDAHQPLDPGAAAPPIRGLDFCRERNEGQGTIRILRKLEIGAVVRDRPLGLKAFLPAEASVRDDHAARIELSEPGHQRIQWTETALAENDSLPLVAVVSAERNPRPGGPPEPSPPPPMADVDTDPFQRTRLPALLSESWWSLRDQWFAAEAYEEAGVRAANTMSTVRNVFAKALGDEASPTFNADVADVVVNLPDVGVQAVHLMSDGWRGFITLLVALSFRASRLNPRDPDAATHTSGIVIIDEVEQHLHPALQLTVLGSLRRAFPRMQIIATTHSPLVMADASGIIDDPNEGGSIFRIDRVGHTQVALQPLPSTSGRTVQGIVTGPWFGLESTLDPLTLRLLARHRMAVRKGDEGLPERRELEKELRARLQPFSGSSVEELVISVVAELGALPEFQTLDHAAVLKLRERTLSAIRAQLS